VDHVRIRLPWHIVTWFEPGIVTEHRRALLYATSWSAIQGHHYYDL
jgi:hypothetical protein